MQNKLSEDDGFREQMPKELVRKINEDYPSNLSFKKMHRLYFQVYKQDEKEFLAGLKEFFDEDVINRYEEGYPFGIAFYDKKK